MPAAIFFDVDGTLIDSNDLHAAAWREAFLHFGHDIPIETVHGQIGKGGDNLIPTLLPDIGAEEQARIEEYRSSLFKRDYLPRVVPFPGVRPLFERLYGDGQLIVLASSASEEEVAFHMSLTGCADLIFATTSHSDVEHSKPCPDIFASALDKVGPIEAPDVVVIGDSPYDMEAAAKLGIASIGLLSGGFPEAVLREAGAAEIHADISALLAAYEHSLIGR